MIAIFSEEKAMTVKRAILSAVMFVLAFPCLATGNSYPWQMNETNPRHVASQIPPPTGFRRTEIESGTFADWLRHLPLKKRGAPVLLHDGKPKANQGVHVAVIDIDTGTKDLQQCADAIIRLRAEYLYSRKDFTAIHFNFTSGDKASFTSWLSGYRPIVKGNRVTWAKQANKDISYSNFRKYLRTVFVYAGSHSLSRELQVRKDASHMQIGDVFIKGGFPGHAVVVLDMAENDRTGQRVFLLAQSYMPAQDIHIMKNPTNASLSPWYKIPLDDTLRTPEWIFEKFDLKCFAPKSETDNR